MNRIYGSMPILIPILICVIIGWMSHCKEQRLEEAESKIESLEKRLDAIIETMGSIQNEIRDDSYTYPFKN